MQINTKAMAAAGYEVEIDAKRGTVIIYPHNPVQPEFAPLCEHLTDLGCNERDISDGIDAMMSTLHNAGIVRAIKAQD